MEAIGMVEVLVSGNVKLTTLAKIYWNETPVVLAPVTHVAIKKAADRIAEVAAGNVPVYGVNTGFGKLASIRIDSAD